MRLEWLLHVNLSQSGHCTGDNNLGPLQVSSLQNRIMDNQLSLVAMARKWGCRKKILSSEFTEIATESECGYQSCGQSVSVESSDATSHDPW